MNRTTSIVLNHSVAKEILEARKGIPYCSREELSFAGRTLAAKWAVKNKKKLFKCTDFYFKFWRDNPHNESDYEMAIYWGGMAGNFDERMTEIETLANDKNEQKLDLDYVSSCQML